MTPRALFPSLALALAAPAAAQSVDQDVRCMIASNIFASVEKDPKLKQIAQVSSLYYFGRVDARLNPAQLKAQIISLGKTMNKTTLGPTMTTCARQFGQKQQALAAMGKSMTEAAPAPAPAAPKK